MRESDPVEGWILKSVFGALFFRVPNQGMAIRSSMAMSKGQENQSLMAFFGRNTSDDSLNPLIDGFCRIFNYPDSRVVSFYETYMSLTSVKTEVTGEWTQTGPRVVLVEKTSAFFWQVLGEGRPLVSAN